MDNLLDYRDFNEGEIELFLRDYRCAYCRGAFIAELQRESSAKKFVARCPKCKHLAHDTNAVYSGKFDLLENEERAMRLELYQDSLKRSKGKRSESDILSDLGF